MTALIIVDLQNDFLPTGTLPVPDGDLIIPIINKISKNKKFDTIVATKDWHPKNHGSFASQYNKNVGDHIILDGVEQILWPDHCVQNTSGSEFPDNLDTQNIDKIVFKGTDRLIDSYGAFFDNARKKETELEDYLKANKIDKIFICGLATDYCVKHSVLDAIDLGFDTYVVVDACRGVDLVKGDSQRALRAMEQAGAKMIKSSQLS